MAKVFLSYRRDDSGHATDRIGERLVAHFGRDAIFRDLDSIRPGIPFPETIQGALEECVVFLAVIGRQWLDMRDPSRPHQRRLNDPADFVHIEIDRALRRGSSRVRVIPLLVDGAKMPPEKELPEALKHLSGLHALMVRSGPDFDADMRKLIGVLEEDGVLPGRVTELPTLEGKVKALVRSVERFLLPPRLSWEPPGQALCLLFTLGCLAVLAGGVVWNFVASGLLTEGTTTEPHGRAALAWPLVTMLFVLPTVFAVNLRFGLVSAGRQVIFLLLFLAGLTAGSWVFYDAPLSGRGGVGVRQYVVGWGWPFLGRESFLVLAWSSLLSGCGFLGGAVALLPEKGVGLRAVLRILGKQVSLCVGVPTAVVAIFLVVLSDSTSVTARGILAGVTLRLSMFFGLLLPTNRVRDPG